MQGGKGPAGAKALCAHNEKQRPGKVDLQSMDGNGAGADKHGGGHGYGRETGNQLTL